MAQSDREKEDCNEEIGDDVKYGACNEMEECNG